MPNHGSCGALISEPFSSSVATDGLPAARNPDRRVMAQGPASRNTRPQLPTARTQLCALPHLLSDPSYGGNAHRQPERITAVASLCSIIALGLVLWSGLALQQQRLIPRGLPLWPLPLMGGELINYWLLRLSTNGWPGG